MTKKKSANYYLKRISQWYLKPTLVYKPEGMSHIQWFEFLWKIDQSSIINYRAKNDFEMPGVLWLTPKKRVHSKGHRSVKKNDILTVRKDLYQNHIDVEMNNNGFEQVFELTFAQWKDLVKHIERVD